MLITADHSADQPIYRQIMDQLRQLIAAHRLRVDDPLPPVRQLAADLGVNLNTVAVAYRELAAEGLLEIRHGRGVRVAAADRQPLDEEEIRRLLVPALSKMILAGKSDREIIRLVRRELRTVRGERE
jgi:GntR family transcriptional regulator